MLQRIQTVFMFLATVAGILFFFFPIASYISNTVHLTFFIHLLDDAAANPFNEMAEATLEFGQWFTLPLAIGQFLIIVILLFTIFQFKKRSLQIRLNLLSIFLNVLLVGGVFYYTTILEGKTGVTSQYGVGVVFPLLAIILIFMANYYIRKDEKLIQSANRLR